MAAVDIEPVVPMNNCQESLTEGVLSASAESQTAQDYINSQLQLEAEAREVLPYQFDACTRALGPLRQSLFSCLTCNPPPARPSDPYIPAGVCYSCSISCHGEHTLVELFSKRNFVCDCGTAKIPSTSPCILRVNAETGFKGGVHSETPATSNKYNHNFRNRFCGCRDDYNPHEEKGTMFQCLGLGTVEDGGCGEDWWHPECIMGLDRTWQKKDTLKKSDQRLRPDLVPAADEQSSSAAIVNNYSGAQPPTDMNGPSPDETEDVTEEAPLPPGFPGEDDFHAFICYKCADAFPWIKRYASTAGFLPAIAHQSQETTTINHAEAHPNAVQIDDVNGAPVKSSSRKRKAEDITDVEEQPKRQKSNDLPPSTEHTLNGTHGLPAQGVPTQQPKTEPADSKSRCSTLPPPPSSSISLFLKEDFRDHLCRCPQCFPLLAQHPQLLEEEEAYEPPLSEDGDDNANRTGSIGTGSLLDRGEAALSNVDRVRAIEGVMAYNHLRDKVKSFLQPFAESGQAVGAEDVKAYFEKLRGDAEAINAAGAEGRGRDERGDEGDQRKEQSGY